jgi:hypothetical protein
MAAANGTFDPSLEALMKLETKIGCSATVPRALEQKFDYSLEFKPDGVMYLYDADGHVMAPLRHVGDEEESSSRAVFRGNDERGATFKIVIPTADGLSKKAKDAGLAHIGVLYAGVGNDLGAVSSLVIPQIKPKNQSAGELAGESS